jgi:hypothetical protein
MAKTLNPKPMIPGSATAVTVRSEILQETDKLRGEIPRSRWFERALIMYNTFVKENMNTTILQSASQVGSPVERNTVTVVSSDFCRSADKHQNPEEVASVVKKKKV